MNELAPKTSALAQLPDHFHKLNGARKINAILDLDDPKTFVRSLAPDELYLVIADIGVSDSLELIGMSTVEQRQAFVDIDCWSGDRLDASEMETWIDTLRGIDKDLAAESISRFDPELLVDYILSTVVTIFDRMEEDDIAAHDAAYEQVQSLDGDFFFILPYGDSEAVGRLKRLLDLMYRWDLEQARHIITLARTGLRLENEELAYQFRIGRMSDLGFPDMESSWGMFQGLAPAQLRAEMATEGELDANQPFEDERVHWALARVRTHRSFLAQCAEGIEDKERFARDFAACVNRAVVAITGESKLREVERVAEISQRVHDTISLGLEIVAEGALASGTETLRHAWLMKLFQVGQWAAQGLARRAAAIQRRAPDLLEGSDATLIEALLRTPQPLMISEQDTLRVFRSRADVDTVAARLGRIEHLLAVFEQVLGFDAARLAAHEFANLSEDDRHFITLPTLARTLVAHLAAGGAPSFEPLTVEQLATSWRRRGDLDGAVAAMAEGLAPEGRAVLEEAAEEVAALYGELNESPDARFVASKLLVESS